jgi:hypothetical protein
MKDDDSAYFYDLRMVCGGYAYYLTYTIFVTFTNKGREVRSPSTVSIKNLLRSAQLLGNRLIKIDKMEDYNFWLYKRGWALIVKEFAQSNMRSWLKSAECIKSAINLFTDVKIVSPSALKHSVNNGRKNHVILRDGKICLACGAAEGDSVKLTMQHIKPFSRAGETTSHNLVTLCNDCNQKYGPEEITELYQKAKLHFGYDPSIINGISTKESRLHASELSDNLMQTRCEIW